jgi:hypothetical protein
MKTSNFSHDNYLIIKCLSMVEAAGVERSTPLKAGKLRIQDGQKGPNAHNAKSTVRLLYEGGSSWPEMKGRFPSQWLLGTNRAVSA